MTSKINGFIHFPQKTEMVASLLPRPWLNWLEVHGWPEIVSPEEVARCLEFWGGRKVALVKQSSYWAMYDPAPLAGKWEDTVLGNQGHLGPMSFLSDLGADYFVVHQEQDPECFLWKLKYVNCPNPEERFRARMEEMEAWLATSAAKSAVRCEDIPWDRYDLVVSMDICIPDQIVHKCRRTCWAYFSTEPGSPLQKEALKKPRAGYRLFLNHGFRRYRCRPGNRSHVLEFPYSFQSLAAWNSLAIRLGHKGKPRKGILVEKGSWPESPPSASLPCTKLQGNLTEYLGQMFSHRYALRTDPKPRWGNWAVEAILAGNLFLGRAESLDHRSTLLPGLVCSDFSEALRRAEEIESQGSWHDWLACQQEMAEHLAFRRPLMELTRHCSPSPFDDEA